MSVLLVGAGPGSADLLTLRAARALGEAQVVVHDRLVDPSVLALVNRDARLVNVGKGPGESFTQARINERLIDLAQRYERVVRLKGGDPFVFGRGGEEWLALRAAGVEVAVVPGLTSALAGPLAAGIPVTHRGLSRGVVIVTGHGADDDEVDVTGLSRDDLTLVILMGVAQRARLARELIDNGRAPSTPVAVVECAWTSSQRTSRGELKNLGELDVRAPAIIIVGAVAALDLSETLALAGVGAA